MTDSQRVTWTAFAILEIFERYVCLSFLISMCATKTKWKTCFESTGIILNGFKITKGRLPSRRMTKVINFWLFWKPSPIYFVCPTKGPSFESSLSEHSMKIERFSKCSTKIRYYFFKVTIKDSIQH